MTQKEKDLLLKDLCARLPYGVILQVGIFDNGDIKYHNKKLDYQLLSLIELDGGYYLNGLLCKYHQFKAKPYIRTMSSMTEEEFEKLKEYSGLKYEQLDLASYQNGTYKCLDFYLSEVPSYVVILVFDWLNAHHFDYRGLIERGLALEAPEGMYNN